MDDSQGRKSACWSKTQILSPSSHDILIKLKELRSALIAEKTELLKMRLGFHVLSSEDQDLDAEDQITAGVLTDG